ncbi:hypothetical protein NON08_12195 [Cetobacterium somerae]|uniref:hypothetical protein n=1 Tax=Cetobacterium sp. NK01 TaxID=2993530 RepID=UPI0021165298|nr:hypothetical protein [Cetobacterium sp. NK01]MCQ8213261.1 hypothetical protein [Cetobacterium sp. NK01]
MDIIDVMQLIENFGLLGKDFIFLESKEEQKDFDLMCVELLEIKYQEVEDGLMLSTSALAYWLREYRWILSTTKEFDIRLILQTGYVYINKKFEKNLKISNEDTIKKLYYMGVDFDLDEDGTHTIDEYMINKFFNKYGSIDLTEIENHFCKFSHLELNIYIDKFYKKELEKRKIELIQKLKKLEIEYTLIDGEIIMSNEVLKVIAKKFSKVKRDLFLTDEENKILRLKNTDFKKIELQINYIY